MFVLAELDIGSTLLIAGLAVLIAVLFLRSHRYFARRQNDFPTSVDAGRKAAQRPGHHLDSPKEMLRWEVEMHDIARELSAQLDSKAGVLQHLIREADRAAARLEATLEEDDRPAPQADQKSPERPSPDDVRE